MKIPQIPTNEQERLLELDSYNILGEMEDSDYDFLTKIASQICGTKISLISLITEDKQWFLSHHGLDVRETPKEFAFCAHAINTPEEIFIIEDSRKDLRFHDNPLVTEAPHVIFYVGVSLVTENGFPLGTLCVIDDKPKHLDDTQVETLKMLSKQVMQVLELRKKTISLKVLNDKFLKTEKLFNESQRINKIGAWELDFETGKTLWTDEIYSIYELPLDFKHDYNSSIEFCHPEDRELIKKVFQNTVLTASKFNVTVRLITAKGNLKWVRITGIKWTQNENQTKLIGSVQDVTNIKLAKERLEVALANNQAVFDASKLVTVITTDLNGLITRVNKGAEIQLGYTAKELIGKYTPEIFHLKSEIEELEKELSAEFNKKIEGFEVFVTHAKLGNPETRPWTYVRKDKTSYPMLLSVTAIRINDEITGYLGIGVDISEIKEAEKDLFSLLNISEDQNDRLKNFAYIVSHNLRNHSAGISMLLELIKEENPEIYKNELVQLLQNAANNLTETINNLTDVVQINEQTKDNFTSVPLKPIVEKNCSSLMALAKSSNVSLINEVHEDFKVTGIPAYFDSIVMNFVTNGIKYSSKERASFVEIKAAQSGDYIVLTFKDNGLGIDLKKYGHQLYSIYKTFHQHKDSRGLGLFITKNQVESMGGYIEVESEVNVGTTFKVFLKK